RLEDGEKIAQSGVETTEPKGEKAPDQHAEKQAAPVVLGMTLSPLDEATRKTYGVAETVKGVAITAVDPSSAAAERQIQPGDVIVEIGQEAVNTPEDVTKRIAALKSQDRRNALLMLADKTGALRFVTVRVE
ncbi:MAG TPA: PDZ domain-containing protein, partial [Mycoplana sp.]|nr:PDZ domain-containing protein [Mycoplana sp.]